MNMYEVTEIATGTPVTGAMSYNEALRYIQKNRLLRDEYSVELYMPIRKAREAKQEGSKFEVKVYNEDGKLQTAFSVDRIAHTAPGNMIAQYPALGTFQSSSHEQDGSHDEYRYSGGAVDVRKLS